MHTISISSYRGNRPTNTQTHRQDQLQYTAPQLVCSVNIDHMITKFGTYDEAEALWWFWVQKLSDGLQGYSEWSWVVVFGVSVWFKTVRMDFNNDYDDDDDNNKK